MSRTVSLPQEENKTGTTSADLWNVASPAELLRSRLPLVHQVVRSVPAQISAPIPSDLTRAPDFNTLSHNPPLL